MPLKIVRNNIVNMECEAIVNTANAEMIVGPGCDAAIYEAAGYNELFKYRRDNIGPREEGEAFITPGFNLYAQYIIHAVSPYYIDGLHGEDSKLRDCYRNSLNLAYDNSIRSIAFPLISTGSFMFPREEGLRIAIDEINAFLMSHDMLVYIVVFDEASTDLGKRIYPDLKEYIDRHYVVMSEAREYLAAPASFGAEAQPCAPMIDMPEPMSEAKAFDTQPVSLESKPKRGLIGRFTDLLDADKKSKAPENYAIRGKAARMLQAEEQAESEEDIPVECMECDTDDFDFEEIHLDKLKERLAHTSDTFSQYLLYLIEEKGLSNASVYKRAIVDKKVFSKIKNNPDYHPQKITAMCLCVGAMLNLDETRDLLARAGYALSPCDKTDILFSYFIENKIYDMIELDIQLEEMGLKCLIS